jgi:hypothetical protein
MTGTQLEGELAMEELNQSRVEQQKSETQSLLLLESFVSQPLQRHQDDLNNLGFSSLQLVAAELSQSTSRTQPLEPGKPEAVRNIGNKIVEAELADQIKKGIVLPHLPSPDRNKM